MSELDAVDFSMFWVMKLWILREASRFFDSRTCWGSHHLTIRRTPDRKPFSNLQKNEIEILSHLKPKLLFHAKRVSLCLVATQVRFSMCICFGRLQDNRQTRQMGHLQRFRAHRDAAGWPSPAAHLITASLPTWFSDFLRLATAFTKVLSLDLQPKLGILARALLHFFRKISFVSVSRIVTLETISDHPNRTAMFLVCFLFCSFWLSKSFLSRPFMVVLFFASHLLSILVLMLWICSVFCVPSSKSKRQALDQTNWSCFGAL